MTGLEKTDPSGQTTVNLPVSFLIMTAVVTITSLVAIVSWWSTKAHAEDSIIHGNQTASMAGGGIAYKGDVERMRADTEKTFAERKTYIDTQMHGVYQQTRRMLRTMVMHCHGTPSNLTCRAELADENYQ